MTKQRSSFRKLARPRTVAATLAVAAVLVAGVFAVRARLQARAGTQFADLWSRDHFELRLETTVKVREATTLELTVRGGLEIVAVDVQPTVLLRGAFMGTVEHLVAPGATAGTAERVQRALQQPFFMEFAPTGELLGLRTPKSDVPFAPGIWQSVASSLQWKRPHAKVDTWESEEADSLGTYVASYTARGNGEFDKRKTRYLKLNTDKVGYAPPSSLQRFAFADGVLASLEVDEKVDATGSDPFPSVSSVSRIELRRTSAPAPAPSSGEPVALARASAKALPLEAPGQVGYAAAKEQLNQQRAAGRTVDSVLAALEMFGEGGESKPRTREESEQVGREYVALAALLATHPEELPRVRAEIEKHAATSAALISALRDAGTAETQAQLRELIGVASLDPKLRGLAARALSHVEAPAPESVAFLEQLQTDPALGQQASYGLGSQVRRLAKLDPELGDATLARLIARLQAATEDPERATLLSALGNAGQAAALDAIEPFTSSASIAVRSSAAQALRRIPGERAERLLANLAGDSEAQVRFSTIDAVSERQPSPVLVKIVAQIAVAEPLFEARLRAANTAGKWLPKQPELRAPLEIVAARDASEDIRRLARAALDRPRDNI